MKPAKRRRRYMTLAELDAFIAAEAARGDQAPVVAPDPFKRQPHKAGRARPHGHDRAVNRQQLDAGGA